MWKPLMPAIMNHHHPYARFKARITDRGELRWPGRHDYTYIYTHAAYMGACLALSGPRVGAEVVSGTEFSSTHYNNHVLSCIGQCPHGYKWVIKKMRGIPLREYTAKFSFEAFNLLL